MNNILNAQEAFTALQKGKTVLCRYAGNGNLHADKNFSTLDQMPATVFVLPNYEFCVQIEMLELAGIKFTKPLTIDEYQDGQDVFVICTYAPSIYVMNFKTNALVESINSGFVQQDAENAKLQLKAISKVLGRELNGDVTITRLGKEPTKPKRKKELEAKSKTVDDDTSLDDIIGPISAQSPSPNTADPELSVLCDAFIAEIDSAKSENDLKAIRTRINSNGDLTEVESAELATRLNLKSASFEKEQSTVSFENVAAAAVAHAQKLDAETQHKNESSKYFDKVKKDTAEWNAQLQGLLKHLENAKTPEEANALVRYTTSWTEEQREPLIRAIHRKLQEIENPQPPEPPSLLSRISNAQDLTELDALEIDVSGRHQDIQPTLMAEVKKRRLVLEGASNNEGPSL